MGGVSWAVGEPAGRDDYDPRRILLRQAVAGEVHSHGVNARGFEPGEHGDVSDVDDGKGQQTAAERRGVPDAGAVASMWWRMRNSVRSVMEPSRAWSPAATWSAGSIPLPTSCSSAARRNSSS